MSDDPAYDLCTQIQADPQGKIAYGILRSKNIASNEHISEAHLGGPERLI